jgi:hypothetical protein
MPRRAAFALGLPVVVCLARAATGCSTSSNLAGNSDAGEDVSATDSGVASGLCFAGCLCSPVDACPSGCYVSQGVQPDGSLSEACENEIMPCVPGGGAWSFGETTSCPGLHHGSRIALPDYPVTYLDGGPDGAFCCDLEHEYAALDAAADTGADDATDGGPLDAGACVPSGCTASCAADMSTRNISHVVNGCLVWQCCVPDDAGTE